MTALGWCPQCGTPLSTLNLNGRGFCPEGHGWVWAAYQKPKKKTEEEVDE